MSGSFPRLKSDPGTMDEIRFPLWVLFSNCVRGLVVFLEDKRCRRLPSSRVSLGVPSQISVASTDRKVRLYGPCQFNRLVPDVYKPVWEIPKPRVHTSDSLLILSSTLIPSMLETLP